MLQTPATLKLSTSLIVHADRGTDLKLSGTKRLVNSAAHGLEENVLQLLSSGRVAAVLGLDISRAELTAQVQKERVLY